MIIIATTWEDDQFGPMMQYIEQIENLDDVIRVQQSSCYQLYTTELSYVEASNILEAEPYGADVTEHGVPYMYNPAEFSDTWEVDEHNERLEAASILMKLKQNKDVKNFDLVPERDWSSLKDCNMLAFFYPFAKGVSYREDMAEFNRLKQEGNEKLVVVVDKPVVMDTPVEKRKQLHELSKEDYSTLAKMGFLFELFPAATGNYETDTCRKKITKLFVHGCKETNYEVGQELGLSDEALKTFAYAAYEVELQVEVNLDTGENEIIGVDGKLLK